jgi:hypothetical protein
MRPASHRDLVRQTIGCLCADIANHVSILPKEFLMIRKLASGAYRLYSRKTDPKTGKRRNLGTFDTLEQARQHEREVQYFKRR